MGEVPTLLKIKRFETGSEEGRGDVVCGYYLQIGVPPQLGPGGVIVGDYRIKSFSGAYSLEVRTRGINSSPHAPKETNVQLESSIACETREAAERSAHYSALNRAKDVGQLTGLQVVDFTGIELRPHEGSEVYNAKELRLGRKFETDSASRKPRFS